MHPIARVLELSIVPLRCAALACLIAFFLCIPTAHALSVIRQIDPGEQPRLDDDEALLAIAVDTSIALDQLRIERIGFSLNAAKFRTPPQGRTMQLYAVPVGRYRWERARVGNWYFTLSDDVELQFEVKPGVINYPGDLLVRPAGGTYFSFRQANRALLAIDWLHANHPALAAAAAVQFNGHYEDPFPARYRAVVADRAVTDISPPVPASGALPLPIAELWRDARVRVVDLNRRGDLLGEVVFQDKTWGVDLFDLEAGTSTRVLESPLRIRAIEWSGDRNLIISVGEQSHGDVFVLQVREGADGRRIYRRLQVGRTGYVVDALPAAPDAILFASVGHLGLHVHRLDISSQETINRETFHARNALDRGVTDDMAWFADAKGDLRVALASRGGGVRLLYGRDGKFEEGPLLKALEGFVPHALSQDGTLLYGIASTAREQAELVAFDIAGGSITKTLYKRAGTDIVAPVMDDAGQLIGASYHEHGQLVTDYFDAADIDLDRRLRAAFPNRSVWLLDRNEARNQYILAAGGSDQPDRIYHLDLDARRASLLDESHPWLGAYTFNAAQVLRARTRDGVDLEAYLTLPPRTGEDRVPLVVMPHGGPIGVRDTRAFDPMVQFVASLGYAVLQVNFRGSTGFGRAFREAGERGFGTVIEDDIDAALQAALAAHPIDAERMCIFGASYGGYSALISSVRWPGRFRCVISMSGVTDRLLQFTASDSSSSAEGRKTLVQLTGDPVADRERFIEHSPLYRIEHLRDPILLLHGTQDMRVDYEQTRRLARMLQLAGRPPTLVRLEGEGHGIDDPDRREAAWGAVAGFLRTHLDAPAAPVPP